jgi:hypothetical protein
LANIERIFTNQYIKSLEPQEKDCEVWEGRGKYA